MANYFENEGQHLKKFRGNIRDVAESFIVLKTLLVRTNNAGFCGILLHITQCLTKIIKTSKTTCSLYRN